MNTLASVNLGRPSFAGLLRLHRARRGMTQRQLADLSTVSVRTIRDLELGHAHRPRKDTARLIADSLRLGSRERIEFEIAAHQVATATDIKSAFDAEPLAPPRSIAKLVGRENETAVLSQMLGSASHRWITLTGVSGVGKTMTATMTAGVLHESHGLAVLWSTTRTDSDARPKSDAISAVIQRATDRLLSGPESGADELASLVEDRPALLVVDGCDPMVQRLDRLVELLEHCRGLRVLATARAPADVPGERVFPLGPLPLPDQRYGNGPERLTEVPSVRLLLDHIHDVLPDFALTPGNADAIAELCHCLDGIPAALVAIVGWFQVDEPGALVDYVRTDPFDLIASTLPKLRGSLSRTVAELEREELTILATLVNMEPGWSIQDVAEKTGYSPVTCARLIRRLHLLGLVRQAGENDRTRFQVLDLVCTPQVDVRLHARKRGIA